MTTASVRNFPRTASRGNDRVDDPNSRPLKPELVDVSPEQQKLALLMEYIGKVIKLGDKPVFQIKDYRKAGFPDFARGQQEIEGLYEVHLDAATAWLCVPRLKRQDPPLPPQELQRWIVVKSLPEVEPALREEIFDVVSTKEKDRLIKEGILSTSEAAPSLDETKSKSGAWDVILHWQKQPQALHDAYKDYLAIWTGWQSKELRKLPTLELYQKLHSLLQRLQVGDSSQPIELVWGLGRCLWKAPASQPENAGQVVDLPCVEVPMTLRMEDNGEIRVLPEELSPALNLDAFQAFQLPGFSSALQQAQKALDLQLEAYGEVNPFQPETFLPVLEAVRNHIDPGAQFLRMDESEGKLPSISDSITVTDAWILYVRPRREHVILQDIERLSDKIAATDVNSLPELARRLVKEPGSWEGDGNRSFQSGSFSSEGGSWGITETSELYFPKAYNEEQVAVVRALENSDGVVVQGPPGTGKTHTIANLICHYMAMGQKVLVVSKKEPALKVLKEQLPPSLQALVISLLIQERAGSKQLEKAVEELQSIADRQSSRELQDQVTKLKEHAARLRVRVSEAEYALAAIAKAHLSGFGPDQQKPIELARRLVRSAEVFEWFKDRPRQLSRELPFGQGDIEALCASLSKVGKRIEHLDIYYPFPNQVATTDDITRCHRNLCRIQELGQKASELPKIKVTTAWREDLESFLKYSRLIQDWQKFLETHPWVDEALSAFETDAEHPLGQVLREFHAELKTELGKHAQFVKQPVSIPDDFHNFESLNDAIARQARGQSPFPITKALIRGREKALLAQVRVAGIVVTTQDGWQHVHTYIEWRLVLSSLLSRWEAMQDELGATGTEASSAVRALQEVRKVLDGVQEITENILPEYSRLGNVLFSAQRLVEKAVREPATLQLLMQAAELGLKKLELESANDLKQVQLQIWQKRSGPLATEFKDILRGVGLASSGEKDLASRWQACVQELSQLHQLREDFGLIRDSLKKLEDAGAPQWSENLKLHPENASALLPSNWAEAWDWAATWRYLEEIDQRSKIQELHKLRESLEEDLRRTLSKIVEVQTHCELQKKLTTPVRAGLMAFTNAMKKLGKGTGKQAGSYRKNARHAMHSCYGAVPCWIMPSHRVSEHLPPEPGAFDLVIIDEASQSDITELPALLRGKKVLVVGDDKQVTPLQVGIGGIKIQQLQFHYLNHFPANHQGFLSVDSSIYDLMRYLYAQQPIMLREHFRCVEPIIRFSMQFYDNRLIPLRIPSARERLDPPLVDLHVPWGRRSEKGVKVNTAEAKVIVDEIKEIVRNPGMMNRTIGVISLIGAEQAHYINEALYSELTEEEISRHKIMCGDSATFQGNERDIIFLSMVHDGQSRSPQSADQPMYQQRFNVALSRARDRMVLVRSLTEEDLSENDLKLKVIQHFKDPMPHLGQVNIGGKEDLFALCESGFEKDMLAWLLDQGYAVTPQVGAEGFRIDFVAESSDGKRLAIECDGDSYHGPDQWRADLRRQRILERVGWKFWRCWASSFYLYREEVLADLRATLEANHIHPREDGFTAYRFTETRVVEEPASEADHEDVGETSQSPVPIQMSLNGILGNLKVKPDSAVVVAPGTRVTVQFLDENKIKQFILRDHNPEGLADVITPEMPLGRALLDAGEEDAEFEFPLSRQKSRKGIILNIEPA